MVLRSPRRRRSGALNRPFLDNQILIVTIRRKSHCRLFKGFPCKFIQTALVREQDIRGQGHFPTSSRRSLWGSYRDGNGVRVQGRCPGLGSLPARPFVNREGRRPWPRLACSLYLSIDRGSSVISIPFLGICQSKK